MLSCEEKYKIGSTREEILRMVRMVTLKNGSLKNGNLKIVTLKIVTLKMVTLKKFKLKMITLKRVTWIGWMFEFLFLQGGNLQFWLSRP